MKGNYLQSPIWNLRIRREARLEAEAELAYTAEEAKRAEVGDIYRKLSRLLAYDEYAWQRETGLRITDSFRAEGLHLPLYQCRTCGAVHRMAFSIWLLSLPMFCWMAVLSWDCIWSWKVTMPF